MRLEAESQSWPIRGRFRIARGEKRAAEPVVARILNGAEGRGEATPYARYGETLDSVLAQIRSLVDEGGGPLERDGLQRAMSPGAARAAVDCALWDWEAKTGARSVADGLAALLGAAPAPPGPLTTAFTISLDEPDAMAEAARAAGDRPVLKLKLGGDADLDCVRAVRKARGEATLIADANEGWTAERLADLAGPLADLGVALIEQPLPAGEDAALAARDWPVPVCADESVHTRADLEGLSPGYGAINIKIDKAGGLTEAALLAAEARQRGLKLMVGCMVATSLSMAPAAILASAIGADFVDLDGPLLLERDRPGGLTYRGAVMEPPSPDLWG